MVKAYGKKDRWKSKKKYKIITPENFGSTEMGLIVSSNPENLIDRRITYSIRDITQEKQKQHINVTFRIKAVDGDKALTRFDALNVDRKYLMSRIVPGHTVIDLPYIVKLKDAEMKLAMNILTAYKIHTAQKRDMIKIIPVVLNSYKKEGINSFLDLVISGRTNVEIFKNLKKIAPIKRVEIREMKTLKLNPIAESAETEVEAKQSAINKMPESERSDVTT